MFRKFLFLILPLLFVSTGEAATITWRSPNLDRNSRIFGSTWIESGAEAANNKYTLATMELTKDTKIVLIMPQWMEKFNVDDLLGTNTDATISDMKMYAYSAGGITSIDFEIGIITAPWTPATVTWNTAPAITWSGQTQTVSITSGAYGAFELDWYAAQVVAGTTNYGVAIRRTSASGTSYISGHLNTYQTRPYFTVEVTYTDKLPFWYSQWNPTTSAISDDLIFDTYIRGAATTFNYGTTGGAGGMRVTNTPGGEYYSFIDWTIPWADTLSGLDPVAAYAFGPSLYYEGQTATDGRQNLELRGIKREWIEGNGVNTGPTFNTYDQTNFWGGGTNNFINATAKSLSWGGIADSVVSVITTGNAVDLNNNWCFNVSTKVDSLKAGTLNGFFIKYTDAAAALQGGTYGTAYFSTSEYVDTSNNYFPGQIIITFEYPAEVQQSSTLKRGPMSYDIGRIRGIF